MITSIKKWGAARWRVVQEDTSTYLEVCLICVWLLCLLVLHSFCICICDLPDDSPTPSRSPLSLTCILCWFPLQQPFLWPWCQMGEVPSLSINTPTLLNSMQDERGLKLTMNAQHFSPPSVLPALRCSFHPYSIRYVYQLKRIIVRESTLSVWSLEIIEELKVTRRGRERGKKSAGIKYSD